GVAENYHNLLKSNAKKSETQKRDIRAINRAKNENAGITVNFFNGVLMDDQFLEYVVGEFNRYVSELDAAVRQYQSNIG
ncbi:TPA: hypothetical protein JD890_27070, partial [Citrobacter freundii]|nr:hypothetical protein [Citrobacter freundii]